MRPTFVSIVALGVVFGIARPAHANLGRGYAPGLRGAEPTGLREIAIEAEQLSFDLRPLAERGTPRVEATYHLDNRGATVTAPLVFVTGIQESDDVRVTFDGRALADGDRPRPLARDELAALPAAWRSPPTTPSLDGGAPISYETEGAVSFAFQLTVPPGRHALAVSYLAHPQSTRSHRGGTLVWQLGYVLAPARDWGSFGTLEVSVTVPPGWEAAVEPALPRTGDTLRARFAALPADTLAITTRASTGALHQALQVITPLLCLLALVAGCVVLYAVGRARGRTIGRIWPRAFGVAIVWAVGFAVTGSLFAFRSELALPANQSGYYGYDHAAMAILATLGGLLLIPIGIAIAVGAGRRSWRATMAMPPEPPADR